MEVLTKIATPACAYLLLQQLQLFTQATPVGLRRLSVPLTPEGPGLGQGPAPLRFPPGILRLRRSLRAQRRPLLALVQPLLQLKVGTRVFTAGTGSGNSRGPPLFPRVKRLPLLSQNEGQQGDEMGYSFPCSSIHRG